MRTFIIIAGGFALLAICVAIARLFGGSGTLGMTRATIIFVILWFAAAAANMWVGVYRAGYSIREELPVFLLIFLLPAAVAVLVKWKFF
jgi:hypothetical protein